MESIISQMGQFMKDSLTLLEIFMAMEFYTILMAKYAIQVAG